MVCTCNSICGIYLHLQLVSLDVYSSWKIYSWLIITRSMFYGNCLTEITSQRCSQKRITIHNAHLFSLVLWILWSFCCNSNQMCFVSEMDASLGPYFIMLWWFTLRKVWIVLNIQDNRIFSFDQNGFSPGIKTVARAIPQNITDNVSLAIFLD